MANPEQLAVLKSGAEAWNLWRIAHAYEQIDLRDANLSGVDLSQANLRRANLDNAFLSGARLRRAILRDATLRKADLGRAHLNLADFSVADLSHANLSGADLSQANLSETNLSGADLSGADLSRAGFEHTVIRDTNLTDAKGLDSCRHWGTSTIDQHTLAKSGELPAVFLRGAGVLKQPSEEARSIVETTPSVLQPEPVVQPAVVNLKLFIAARRLDSLWMLPVTHLSLVVREEDGAEYEYEGNPQQQGPGSYGKIIVTKRSYRPRPDRQSLRVPLPWDQLGSDAITVLNAALERINAATIAYNPVGPNSNTTVRTLLLSLGLQPLQPAALAPGFEHEAL